MLQPLRGKILVEVLHGKNRTDSGLYLSSKEEVPSRGRVVEIGAPYQDKKGREFPWGLVAGHIVHFKRIWDQNKVTHYILKREQIFAVECEGKAYAFSDYVLIKKISDVSSSILILPKLSEIEVSKQDAYGEVVSVGIDNKQGIEVGDNIAYFKNEGLKVQIPLQDELLSLKPRAIFAKA